MHKLNRKYLITGSQRTGKSRMLQDIYDTITAPLIVPDHLQERKWEFFKQDFVPHDDYDYGKYAYVEHMAPAVSGFKTGDLRIFNYEVENFRKREEKRELGTPL